MLQNQFVVFLLTEYYTEAEASKAGGVRREVLILVPRRGVRRGSTPQHASANPEYQEDWDLVCQWFASSQQQTNLAVLVRRKVQAGQGNDMWVVIQTGYKLVTVQAAQLHYS